MNPPAAGLFGKLPATGDFVARGLPDSFRRIWDDWVTRHLAVRLRAGVHWPEEGLRFRLTSGGRVAAGVVLASRDSAGRAFPLSLVLIGDMLPGPPGLDGWCDQAARAGARAMAEGRGADWLWQRLAEISVPDGDVAEEHGRRPGPEHPGSRCVLWTDSSRPAPVDPAKPGAVLDRLLPLSSG